jgi:3-oxoacyl-[acyl-carrier protein] reductase
MLKDKIALITGGSRGIGAATAKLFAQNGAKVVINYNSNKQAAVQVAGEIIGIGGIAMISQADVTEVMQVDKMMNEIKENFGEVEVLVINAGVHFKIAPYMQLSWDDFSQKYMSEMKAFFNTSKAVLPAMIDKKNGVIVAVSSGLSRHPGLGFSSHSASKSAIDALVKSLALELGEFGIRVNTVAPGLTITDATNWMPEDQQAFLAKRTALKKNGMPEDMANAILFMASNLSSHITGTYLSVDGGVAMI